MNKLEEIIKIAYIHAAKILLAQQRLKNLFPVNASKISKLVEEEFLFIELLTSRFSKLQDFIGTKLIDAFFEKKGEIFSDMTLIDKVNKLERLNIIDHSSTWLKMREVRNHLAHEYPEHPEITAAHLNQVFTLSPQLLNILNNIKNKSK